MKLLRTIFLLAFLMAVYDTALANCRAEIAGLIPDQFGHIILFSSLAEGPTYQHSTFWAVTGPSDNYRLAIYPVRFTPELQKKVSSWDWSYASVHPKILRVHVDGVFDGELIWLEVKEIFFSVAHRWEVDGFVGVHGNSPII